MHIQWGLKMTLKGISRFVGYFAAIWSLHSMAESKPGAQHFQLDPSHTQVMFRVSHLGFSYVQGQFTEVKGEFTLDEQKLGDSKIKIEIDANSVNTHNSDRDEHLRKEEGLLGSKKYPKIVFTSTKVSKQVGNVYTLDGNLEMHGKTKPVSFAFTRLKTGPDMKGKTRTGGFGSLVIKRSDFGMNYMQGKDKIGDEVEITINVEAVLE